MAKATHQPQCEKGVKKRSNSIRAKTGKTTAKTTYLTSGPLHAALERFIQSIPKSFYHKLNIYRFKTYGRRKWH